MDGWFPQALNDFIDIPFIQMLNFCFILGTVTDGLHGGIHRRNVFLRNAGGIEDKVFFSEGIGLAVESDALFRKGRPGSAFYALTGHQTDNINFELGVSAFLRVLFDCRSRRINSLTVAIPERL